MIEPIFSEDGLINFSTGLGTGCDSRTQSRFYNTDALSTDRQQLIDMYRADWASGKTVDILPDDMVREWRSFNGEIESDVLEKLVAEEERLNIAKKMNEGLKWARLFGGALLVLGVEDGGESWEPLDLDRVRPNGFKSIHALDRWAVTPSAHIDSDMSSSNFGLPMGYTLITNAATEINIHHSRVIRLEGIKLPYDDFVRNNYWGDSVLSRLLDPLKNQAIAMNSAIAMIKDANVDVIKVDGLMEKVANPQQESAMIKRFHVAAQMKSMINMLLLDKREEHDVKNYSFAGLPELIDRSLTILAAASDIPATRYLGKSPGGLDSTGDSDLVNYYDSVRSHQQDQISPALTIIDKIMARSLRLNDQDLSFDFDPLFQLSEQAKSEIELRNSQRDQIYEQMGVIEVSMITSELKNNHVYSGITDEFIAELESTESIANASAQTENDPNSSFGEGTQPEANPFSRAASGTTAPSEADS